MSLRFSTRDGSRGPAHACRIEPLEDRRLLTLTVITHDAAASFPAWVYDMGAAVARRNGSFDTRDQNGNSIPDVIENARYTATGERELVGSGQVYDDLILFDWSGTDLTLELGEIGDAIDVLANLVNERILAASNVLDVHLIGHGMGAAINYSILRQARYTDTQKIGFVQVTSLDPDFYPNNNHNHISSYDLSDVVDFADNYYQDILAADPVHGVPVVGALNFNLSATLFTGCPSWAR